MTGPTNPGVGNWTTFGDALAYGLAGGVNNYLQTSNTLQQQHLQQQNLEQQRLFQQQQAEEARRQFDVQQGNVVFNQQRQTQQDDIANRESDFKAVLAPQMNTFMEGVMADLAHYAPTLKDGSPNPQYDPALYQAAQDRKKEALKRWSAVGLSVGHGENWEQNKTALTSFIGGEATPGQGSAAPTPTAQPTTVQSQDGAAASFTLPGSSDPTPAAPSPAHEAQPSTPVQALTGADLVKMSDADLLAHYGQGGLEWGRAKRAAYVVQQQQAAQDAAKIRAKGWDTQLGELSKRTDLDGNQRMAMATITSLMAKPTLSETEAQTLAESFKTLTPKMYDATSWQKVLDTKDPATILAQLPVYQKYAPEVVQGFDVTPYQTKLTDDHNAAAAEVALKGSTVTKNNADAGRVNALLPGEVQAQGDTHAASTTSTNKTSLETKQAAYDLGVKRLATMAVPGATAAQAMKADPAGWAQLKHDLGMTDAMLAAAFGNAAYLNGQKLTAADVDTQLKSSQVLTEGARRAGLMASTAQTQADTQKTLTLLPGQVAQQAAQTQATQGQYAASMAQANASNANAERTSALTPVEVAQGRANVNLTGAKTLETGANTGLTLARTGNVNADTGRIGAQTQNIQQQTLKLAADIQNDRARTQAYVQQVKGQASVDVAHVANLNSQTALNRAKNPNDPLYNPVVAVTKAGDPIDQLKKTANLYYGQADGAMKQAQTIQGQINSLIKQGTGITGTFSRESLTPADQQKLDTLTGQRDHLMQQSINRRAQGDKVITEGLGKAVQQAEQGGHLQPTGTPFKTLSALPGVKLDGLKPQLVSRMDTMLGNFQAPGGLVPVINQGYRTADDQAKLYAQGRTAPGKVVTHSKPGTSLHESGNGVDISWKDPQTGQVLPGNDPRAQAAWKALGAQAPKYGLRWGGTFPGLVDMYHFEVHGTPQVTARAPQPIPQGPPIQVQSAPTPKPTASNQTKQLQAGLEAAVLNSDGTSLNTYGAELMKAGLSQQQVMGLIASAKQKYGRK